MASAPVDVTVTLTPAQATAKLAEMAAPPPPPDKPTNAVEASARLQALASDKDFAQRLLNGDPAVRKEFDQLNAAVAAGDLTDLVMAGVVPAGAINYGDHASLRDQADAVPMLRAAGISDGAIRQLLEDRPVSRAEYDAVKQFQTARHRDPDWQKRLLAGDHAAGREQLLMSIVLSSEIAE